MQSNERKNMRKLAVLALTVMMLAGCKNPYGACEKAALDIGNGITAGYKTIDDLRVAGKISVQEEISIAGFLKFANDGNGVFGACAQKVHSTGAKTGYTVCAQAFQQALANPTELALIHVGNPNSQQEVAAVVDEFSSGVSTLIIALGGN